VVGEGTSFLSTFLPGSALGARVSWAKTSKAQPVLGHLFPSIFYFQPSKFATVGDAVSIVVASKAFVIFLRAGTVIRRRHGTATVIFRGEYSVVLVSPVRLLCLVRDHLRWGQLTCQLGLPSDPLCDVE
jgi:hypothetical protein